MQQQVRSSDQCSCDEYFAAETKHLIRQGDQRGICLSTNFVEMLNLNKFCNLLYFFVKSASFTSVFPKAFCDNTGSVRLIPTWCIGHHSQEKYREPIHCNSAFLTLSSFLCSAVDFKRCFSRIVYRQIARCMTANLSNKQHVFNF